GWQTFTLLVKNEPFTPDEIARLRAFLTERSFDAGYYPGMRREEANRYNVLDAPYFFDGATALLGENPRAFMADYKFNLRPATDDRPYFDNFFKWSSLPEQLALHGESGYPLAERGYLILLATLAQALPIALLLIVAPLPFLRRRASSGRTRALVYFAALGLAFLFIEIASIQRFALFLGHPLYAVALVLASFLIFAGLGAAASGAAARFFAKLAPVPPIMLIAAGVAELAIIYMFALPSLFDGLLAAAAWIKIAVSVALIAPLAFLMGMPFPLGLGALASREPALAPWAWGINGCASVLSPVLATLLAIHWGFSVVIALAAGLYGVAAASAPRQA
ncbi:MAG: SAM-dependent methyltransferase, partial [Pseudomonadota bacterium]